MRFDGNSHLIKFSPQPNANLCRDNLVVQALACVTPSFQKFKNIHN
jgi:hypothetical protein